MICFTGYLREQSKLALNVGAEEFKLAGGKGTANIVMQCLPIGLGECTILSMLENIRRHLEFCFTQPLDFYAKI